MSNLKQLNVALRLYAEDSNDTAPYTSDPSNPLHALTGFKSRLGKYLGASTATGHPLFDCPADKFHYSDLSTTPKFVARGLNQESSSDFSSYGFNGGNATGLPNAHGIAGRKIASIRQPSRIAFALENSGFIPWSWHKPVKKVTDGGPPFRDPMNIISFLDGHSVITPVFWNGNPLSFSMQQEPPVGYAYAWSD